MPNQFRKDFLNGPYQKNLFQKSFNQNRIEIGFRSPQVPRAGRGVFRLWGSPPSVVDLSYLSQSQR